MEEPSSSHDFTQPLITQDLDLAYTPWKASYVVTHESQAPPWESDHVRVKATLLLPCHETTGALVAELQFGDRLRVADLPLHAHWGERLPLGTQRAVSRLFSGPTWRKAESEAEIWCLLQIYRLNAFLTHRQDMMKNASRPK